MHVRQHLRHSSRQHHHQHRYRCTLASPCLFLLQLCLYIKQPRTERSQQIPLLLCCVLRWLLGLPFSWLLVGGGLPKVQPTHLQEFELSAPALAQCSREWTRACHAQSPFALWHPAPLISSSWPVVARWRSRQAGGMEAWRQWASAFSYDIVNGVTLHLLQFLLQQLNARAVVTFATDVGLLTTVQVLL